MTQYSGKLIRKTPLTPTQQSASGVWKLNEQAAAIRNNAWPVAGVPDPISRSVRLRSSASAYFNRTQSASGNGHLFTYSAWVKRGAIATGRLLCTSAGVGSSSTLAEIYFDTSDRLTFFQYTAGTTYTNLVTAQVFRDPSAWYHIVVAYDDAQATAANRVKMYINGVQVTSFSTASYPTQNFNSFFNTGSQPVWIGPYLGNTNFFDGYLTEINFIDGQALTPSSFGTTDQLTGAWVPMAYTGTYGTNGFYLNFKDNTSTTTLGYDYSGNANNWTANNISLTAGTTYDSMLDVPTPWVGYSTTTDTTAVTRGNYCTANPLKRYSNNFGISNGNLTLTDSSSSNVTGACTMSTGTSGKWYFECTMTSVSSDQAGSGSNFIGVATQSQFDASLISTSGSYRSGGSIYNLAAAAQTSGATYTSGSVIGVAVDVTNGTVQFYKNGAAQGATPSFTFTAGTELFPFVASDNVAGTKTFNLNFGQQPFSYTPPTGYKALCATNLPTPTITNGASYMNILLYTGDGTTSKNVTGLTFQPDMVYVKNRSAASDPTFSDSVRGITKVLYSDATSAESTAPVFGYLNSVSSTGINVNSGGSTEANFNKNGQNYVAWNWLAGGSAVSNTNGTITSQVNAGTTQGFSVVTYTGSGSTATVGHGLGVAPKMVIVKRSSGVDSWAVYNANLTSAAYALILNSTAAQQSVPTYWNSTAPTSSVFTISTDSAVNASASTYVAYCFAEVAGYSKFGSYTGNGSADGPFVYCGFRPRYVMVKGSSGATNWFIWDSSRDTYNVANKYLLPNSSSAEDTTSGEFDILSNGFKFRANNQANSSGATYIFAAFAENPFKYSNAR